MNTYPPELSVPQAAKILGVDANTVRRYVRDGELPARDISPAKSTRTSYRVPLDAVEAMRCGYSYVTNTY